MAQQMEKASTLGSFTVGKITYYAYVDSLGKLQKVTDKKLANVDDVSKYKSTKTGQPYRWIKTGGIGSLTSKTEEELKAQRDAGKASRKSARDKIKGSTRKKLLEHPDKEFVEAFMKNQSRKVAQLANKKAKEQSKKENKNIKRKARLEAKIALLKQEANKL